MKKSLLLITVLFLFVSCQNKNQEKSSQNSSPKITPVSKNLYTYNLVLNDYDYSNRPKTTYLEPEIIEAENDSVAYYMAVKKFYTRMYASKLTEANMGENNSSLAIKVAYPKLFVLHTADGKDISEGLFLSDPLKVKHDIERQLEKIYQRNLEDMNNRNNK